ncbi:MAG: ferredoxin family protein [Pseudomonadota bacterium]
MKGRIEIDQELCKGCGLCINVCPNKRIEVSDGINKKGYFPSRVKGPDQSDPGKECTGCALCAITCPDVAIEVYREVKEKGTPEQETE